MEIDGMFFNTTDYIIQPNKLGQGSYGTVYISKNLKDGKKYAAKIFKMRENFDGHDQMLLLRESMILNKLDHPSIVKFKGINFKSFTDNFIIEPTMITEYIPNGSLKAILDKERRSLSDINWNATKKYITLVGVSNAMRYLHSNNILHRDLKPENILIDSNYYPKICDFGLSKCFPDSFSKSMKLTITGQFGTPLYLSPEVLQGEDHYDSSVDVYAFSILAYEIVSNQKPYFELGKKVTVFKLMNNVINGYRPMRVPGITDKMWNLLNRCWSEKPEERPTFEFIFDELSKDTSYSSESVHSEELAKYLNRLSESKENMKQCEKEKIMMLEKKVKKLKEKMNDWNYDDNKMLSQSKNDFYFGLVSTFGPKESRNSKRAMKELSRASEKGNGYASFILGLLYESGQEVERNIEKSFMYYEKAAKQGNTKGLHRMGVCYDSGLGVEPNYFKAYEYFRKAADLGDPAAMRSLGVLYANGRGLKRDYSKAIEYFEKAADLNEPVALNNLGCLYANGEGVEQNCSKAVEYFHKAADLYDPAAMRSLGILYANGEGVEQNYSIAFQFFKKAAELGDLAAINNLGYLYTNGKCVEKNYSKAVEYFKKAADLGDQNAINNLGYLYEQGRGVEKDYSKAIEYYQKAADLGESSAIRSLGALYENGRGVEQNYIKAIEYYQKAAKLGNSKAAKNLKNLQQIMK